MERHDTVFSDINHIFLLYYSLSTRNSFFEEGDFLATDSQNVKSKKTYVFIFENWNTFVVWLFHDRYIDDQLVSSASVYLVRARQGTIRRDDGTRDRGVQKQSEDKRTKEMNSLFVSRFRRVPFNKQTLYLTITKFRPIMVVNKSEKILSRNSGTFHYFN